jgi:hypothetical protein
VIAVLVLVLLGLYIVPACLKYARAKKWLASKPAAGNLDQKHSKADRRVPGPTSADGAALPATAVTVEVSGPEAEPRMPFTAISADPASADADMAATLGALDPTTTTTTTALADSSSAPPGEPAPDAQPQPVEAPAEEPPETAAIATEPEAELPPETSEAPAAGASATGSLLARAYYATHPDARRPSARFGDQESRPLTLPQAAGTQRRVAAAAADPQTAGSQRPGAARATDADPQRYLRMSAQAAQQERAAAPAPSRPPPRYARV